MRIDRLHLHKYRALEDVALPFAPGARLHLVYGPQEAGKTTALAAITDALFGFPHATLPNAVRFAPGDLRIEMALTASDGATLAFRRRKARDRTLLKVDESGHWPDHVLAPFTGALDRGAFERTFGLTSERLREAGLGLEANGGDAGAALFAASSGLADLGRLTDRLDEEADAIFGARRKASRRFTQIESRHEAARKAEGEAQLTASRWGELRRGLAELEEQDATLAAERAQALRAIRRLEALLRLAPIHARIARLEEELSRFEDLAQVPLDHVAALVRLAASHHHAVEAEASASEVLERERERLRASEVDERHLAQHEAVEALVRRAGAIEQMSVDLPRVARERDEHERDLAAVAGQLGLDVAKLAAGVPTGPALARLAELAREGRSLETERRGVEDALAEARREAAEAPDDDAVDPAPLARRHEALLPDIARVERLPELREGLAEAQDGVLSEAARLAPPVTDMAAACRWNLPDDVALEERLAETAEGARAAEEVARALAQNEGRERDLRAEIERHAEAAAVTRADVEAARARRDAALSEGMALDACRILVRRADELADRAFENAEAVALHEQRLAQLERLSGERASLLDARTEAADRLDAARDRFRALFPFLDLGMGLSDARPERMPRWTAQLRELQRRWGSVEALRREVETLVALDAASRPALEALAEELGCAADLPTGALSRLVAGALGRAGEDWQERRRRRTVEAERTRRLTELVAKAGAVRERGEAWRAGFAEANAACGLDRTFGLAEAEAAIALWQRVPDLLGMRDNAAARVRGMVRDRDAFEAEVAEIVATLDPALGDLSATAAVERMCARCREASLSAAARREIEKAVLEADGALTQARAAADAAQARRDEATTALAGPGAHLAPIIDRLNERDAIVRERDRQRASFVEAAVGTDPDGLEDDLDELDVVEAELSLEALRGEEDARELAARDVHAELVARRQEVAALEAAGGAEEHAFARNMAAAEMAAAGREWLVLRAARHLLDNAVARQRERESGPLMARASVLFARLTGGSFERLEQDYAKETPRIVGVRPNGERVGTDGMSEGTHDQLFLALRLALLEAHAVENEPVPFIADDIFMTFDRERTRHGLLALGEVAGRFQPILFTHHDFVVDEARAALGDRLDLIDLTGARVAALA